MPVNFPTLDPESGELVPTLYYTVGDVADLLHVSQSTVRRAIGRGWWPHLTIAQAHYMSAAHVAEVMEMSTSRAQPPQVDPDPEPPRLGIPLSDTDLEGIR